MSANKNFMVPIYITNSWWCQEYFQVFANANATRQENLALDLTPLATPSGFQALIEFPRSNIECETVTTVNFLRNVYRIIKAKTHLHHSHTTGKNIGYVHDFCNWKVRENKTEFSCIAHNFFGFDMYFFIRGYRATTWNSKNLNIGGTGLTRINFANISNTHKFIGYIFI